MKYIKQLTLDDVFQHLLAKKPLQVLLNKTPPSQIEEVTSWYNLISASHRATLDLINKAYDLVLEHAGNNHSREGYLNSINLLSATNNIVKEARPYLIMRYDNKPLDNVILNTLKRSIK